MHERETAKFAYEQRQIEPPQTSSPFPCFVAFFTNEMREHFDSPETALFRPGKGLSYTGIRNFGSSGTSRQNLSAFAGPNLDLVHALRSDVFHVTEKFLRTF
jgi:hypothetical protein